MAPVYFTFMTHPASPITDHVIDWDRIDDVLLDMDGTLLDRHFDNFFFEEELPRRYAKLINSAIATKPASMTVCVHLCRGNFKSAWAAEGGYEPVAEVLFNNLEVDGYFLEYDDARSGDFRPLRHVPKDKTVVLGLVSTKLDRMETRDDLKRRIDEAAKFMPLEQMCISPQCGFSSTVHGNDIAVATQAAKIKLCVDTARDVWGGV